MRALFVFFIGGVLGAVIARTYLQREVGRLSLEIEGLKTVERANINSSDAFKTLEGEFVRDTYYVSSYAPKRALGGYRDAFGLKLRPGVSCAVNPKDIPYGSLIVIDGRIWIAVDNTGKRRGVIDLCLDDDEAVKNYKAEEKTVWIYLNK